MRFSYVDKKTQGCEAIMLKVHVLTKLYKRFFALYIKKIYTRMYLLYMGCFPFQIISQCLFFQLGPIRGMARELLFEYVNYEQSLKLFFKKCCIQQYQNVLVTYFRVFVNVHVRSLLSCYTKVFECALLFHLNVFYVVIVCSS